MPLAKSDQAELDTLRARLEKSLAGGDDTLTDQEIDRLGELRAKEREGILAAAHQRQQRETARGVDRSLGAEERLQLSRAEGIRSFTDEFAGGVSSILTGQARIGDGFRSMIGNMSKMLADFFARWMVQQAALAAMGWMGIGPTASASAATGAAAIGPGTGFIYHEGGFVGAGGVPSRSVPMSLFAGAPKFHTGGLLRGEVPVIAKRGEGIFTPEQMDNADSILKAATATSGTSITVNNDIRVEGHASGNAVADQELAAQIGRQVENSVRAVVSDEMRRQMRPGGLLRGGY
ncbi:hypothetical protein Sp245p_05565 [Azospirillum baldaniorum]|uniref:Phage tail tape measure protein n=1 Tax=Azospirillum baldaniorum TaxID=1064539 RepID=A0A9P1JSE4_9PROT|nr:hypothetical protein [Azospirillum baldaniorum]AWJ89289.1 hypothetical protein Sp245p_05565 [Azospirillum baldaniorum]TWA80879.1 hypothetical protein FBZ85_103323 [Azospirillum brasilense]CCC98866.1 protein of unknown function [Azospirillum baldaniorum]